MGDLETFLHENITQAEAFGCLEQELAAVKRACAEITHAYDAGGRASVTRYMLDHMTRPDEAVSALRLAILHGESGEMDAAFQ